MATSHIAPRLEPTTTDSGIPVESDEHSLTVGPTDREDGHAPSSTV